jgi:peptidoglycan/xylan/chitin deacetylase (PgdA/CDA1 family)
MHGTVSRTLAAVRRSVRTALFARTVAMRNWRAIVSFTFDDFPRSAVSNGARLLEEHGVRGTFYLTGSYCERVIDDVLQYGAEDLAALAGAGHEIGCHTFTHPRVSTLSAGALNGEIELNAAFLARHLPGLELRTFAYPFGDLSFAATMRLQSRFAGCRSSQPGLNSGTADLGRLRSVRLYDRLIGPADVSDLIKQAVARNAWLIFYTHDVDWTPSRFGCNPALLEHAITSAISAGAEVRPVDAAIKAICTLD